MRSRGRNQQRKSHASRDSCCCRAIISWLGDGLDMSYDQWQCHPLISASGDSPLPASGRWNLWNSFSWNLFRRNTGFIYGIWSTDNYYRVPVNLQKVQKSMQRRLSFTDRPHVGHVFIDGMVIIM